MFNTLIKMKESGILKNFIRAGLMSSKVHTYLEISMWVDAKQKSTTKNLNAIVEDAQRNFGMSKSTIWRALRTMKGTETAPTNSVQKDA